MQYLTKDELTRLLQEARKGNHLHWLAMLVSFRHGLRASEVVGLTGDNIQDGYLTVERLKKSLKTIQPLFESTDDLYNEKSYLEIRAREVGHGRLFPWTRNWFWYLVQKYGKLAEIPAHKRHPHVFKHTVAMLTIKEAGIENLRQWLGHRSISSTGEYLKVNDNEAAKAIEKAMYLTSMI